MQNYNIILAGVGGQGLVLTTKIICEAGMLAGYDVKSEDVVGLSQRGGKVWGSVRLGEKVISPTIGTAKGDFIIGLEPLEAVRMSGKLKRGGTMIINEERINPVPIIAEKEIYPEDIIEKASMEHNVIALNATQECIAIGSSKLTNIMLLGVLAKYIDIKKEVWFKAIEQNVPFKFIDLNKEAFEFGFNYSK